MEGTVIYSSPYPDVEIAEVSVTSWVLRDAVARASKPALIDGVTGRTITYGELLAGIRSVAGALAQRGFGKGDVLSKW